MNWLSCVRCGVVTFSPRHVFIIGFWEAAGGARFDEAPPNRTRVNGSVGSCENFNFRRIVSHNSDALFAVEFPASYFITPLLLAGLPADPLILDPPFESL